MIDLEAEAEAALNMAVDGEDDSEPFDPMMVQQAHCACSAALENAGVLARDIDQRLLQWLQYRNIVSVDTSGEITLVREAIQHGILASGAVLEKTLRGPDCETTLEVQDKMSQMGWRFVDDFKKASAQKMKAMRTNPSHYYLLLTHFRLNVIQYEQEQAFHHHQGDKYYMAFEAAIISQPDAIIDIPAYKPVSFYVALQNFLFGVSSSDPRDAEEKKKSRKRRAVEEGPRTKRQQKQDDTADKVHEVVSSSSVSESDLKFLHHAQPPVPGPVIDGLDTSAAAVVSADDKRCELAWQRLHVIDGNDDGDELAQSGSEVGGHDKDSPNVLHQEVPVPVVPEPPDEQEADMVVDAAAADIAEEAEARSPVEAEAAAAAAPAEAEVPWDVLFPPKSAYREYRDAIVSYALPPLLALLRDRSNALRNPRDLVDAALRQCELDGNKFWGAWNVFTRKRSAADSIIVHYFTTLQDYASGRPVAPV